MGLFRRRRVEEELLELVRTELGTIRAEIQATLGETAAVLSTRVRTEIEHRMGEPHALAAGLQSVRNTIGARDAELAQVLKRVIETCDTLSERVQLDRSERIALTEAVGRLTRRGVRRGDLRRCRRRPTVRRRGRRSSAAPSTRRSTATSRCRRGDHRDPAVGRHRPGRDRGRRPSAPSGPAPAGRCAPTGSRCAAGSATAGSPGSRCARSSASTTLDPLPPAPPLRRLGDPDAVRREGPAVLQHHVRRTPLTAPLAGAARPASSGRSRYVLIPGSASHTYGIAFTQCIAGAIKPDLGLLADDRRVQAVEVTATGGSRVELDLEPLTLGPNVHGGSRCSSPISQFTRTVITGSPSTSPSHVNRCAATVPASSTPTGVSRSLVVDRHLVGRALLGVERPAELGRDHVDRLHEPVAEDRRHRARLGLLRRRPEQHDVAHHRLGRVVADVGELLGAHVADVPAQRGEHEREPLGDAARVDAGAVQRRVAARGTRPRAPPASASTRSGRSSRPASRRSSPTRAAARPCVVLASTGA